jgi:hypothetical protein
MEEIDGFTCGRSFNDIPRIVLIDSLMGVFYLIALEFTLIQLDSSGEKTLFIGCRYARVMLGKVQQFSFIFCR